MYIQYSLIIYIRNNENKLIQSLYILLNIVISTNTITNSIYIYIYYILFGSIYYDL